MTFVGKLNAKTWSLKLHASPNGRVVGYMSGDDEFILADEGAKRNIGGKVDWQRGSVTSGGTTYSNVYVALDRLDVTRLPEPPVVKPPPLPPFPKEKKFRSFGDMARTVVLTIAILFPLAVMGASAILFVKWLLS
jgi:hypothetical protein